MNEDGERDEDDGLCKLSEGNSLVLQYEYHIVYSYSYSTPVLYFRAFTLGWLNMTASLHTFSVQHTYTMSLIQY